MLASPFNHPNPIYPDEKFAEISAAGSLATVARQSCPSYNAGRLTTGLVPPFGIKRASSDVASLDAIYASPAIVVEANRLPANFVSHSTGDSPHLRQNFGERAGTLDTIC